MPSVRYEVPLAKPPSEIFAFLADFENWPKWQSDMKTTQLVEGERAQMGAVYRYHSEAMGQTFDSTLKVSAIEPGRLIAFLEGGYDLAALRSSVAASLPALVGAASPAIDGESSTSGGPGTTVVEAVTDLWRRRETG